MNATMVTMSQETDEAKKLAFLKNSPYFTALFKGMDLLPDHLEKGTPKWDKMMNLLSQIYDFSEKCKKG